MGGPHLNKEKKVKGSVFGWTVGQGQSQGKFFWSDGRTVGRRTDGSFYFALEPPLTV